MLFLQFSNDFKLVEYFFSMRSIFQFIGKILPGPMLVVFAISPEPRRSYLVNQTIKRHPNVRLILSVSKSKLTTCEYR